MSDISTAVLDGFLRDEESVPDEPTRKWLLEKEKAAVPRWLKPGDPLPEIATVLKHGKTKDETNTYENRI